MGSDGRLCLTGLRYQSYSQVRAWIPAGLQQYCGLAEWVQIASVLRTQSIVKDYMLGARLAGAIETLKYMFKFVSSSLGLTCRSIKHCNQFQLRKINTINNSQNRMLIYVFKLVNTIINYVESSIQAFPGSRSFLSKVR